MTEKTSDNWFYFPSLKVLIDIDKVAQIRFNVETSGYLTHEIYFVGNNNLDGSPDVRLIEDNDIKILEEYFSNVTQYYEKKYPSKEQPDN